MNRIKEALENGKWIRVANDDERRQLLDLYPSEIESDIFRLSTYYTLKDGELVAPLRDRPREETVVEFSTLTRSRLAEVLDVEDGQPFKAVPANPDEPETIVDIFVLHGGDFCFYRDGKEAKSAKLLCGLINGKFKAVPITVWSEDSIKTARAAETLRFTHITRNPLGLVCVSVGGSDVWLEKDLFPEIQPGQTVKLSEIK